MKNIVAGCLLVWLMLFLGCDDDDKEADAGLTTTTESSGHSRVVLPPAHTPLVTKPAQAPKPSAKAANAPHVEAHPVVHPVHVAPAAHPVSAAHAH